MKRIRSAVCAGAVAAGLLSVSPVAAYDRPGHYVQIDVATDGTAANGSSSEASIDASGRYVAFSSTANNLGGGTVPQSNVYLRDLVAKRTTLVSRGANGEAATPSTAGTCPSPGGGGLASGLGSVNPSISSTGRYVAFASTDVNLVAGGTPNATSNIYVYDTVAKKMRLASVSTSGTLANGWSCAPSVSANGQRVSFVSAATNLVAGSSGGLGVFVHDFATGKTLRADVSSTGAQATPTCSTGVSSVPEVVPLPVGTCTRHRPAASISNDGRYVVFDSDASNLVSGDTNQQTDVFEHDLKTGATIRISVATGGGQAVTQLSGQDALAPDDVGSFLTNPACNWERHHDVSGDGRYAVFLSRASNLVPGDTNSNPVGAGVGIDVFVRDIKADRTYRVDVSSAGEQNGSAGGVGFWTVGCDISLSADGRYVSLNSTNGFQVYDRYAGTATVFPSEIGTGAAGTTGYSGFQPLDISADGRFVPTLMFNRANNATSFDLFVWDRGKALAVNDLSRGAAAGPPTGCAAQVDPGLRAASIVYRPNSADLFVRLSLTPGSIARARASATVFGIDLRAGDRRYEVRADATAFTLDDGRTRAPVAGGFGTTGEEVVFAIPLRAVGLSPHAKPAAMTAFAGVGTAATGAACVVDRVVLG